MPVFFFQSHLKEIQSAFVSVLSENDELSQDVASKGLGLVYELGNEQDQQELVSTLVETLMTGKRYSDLVHFRFKHIQHDLHILRICSGRRKIQHLMFLFIKSLNSSQ